MRKILQSFHLMVLIYSTFVAVACATPNEKFSSEDPYLWLEEVNSEKATAWADEHTKKTLEDLTADPVYKKMNDEVFQILNAADRIPRPDFHDGAVYNFWQDKQHKQGLVRRTSLESYLSPATKWEILLDLDALSKAEGVTWVWKGSLKCADNPNRVILKLSDGGKDAAVMREYDYDKKEFVQDGFALPESKSMGTWLNADELLIADATDPKNLTTSGYPRVVKRWKRGTPFAAAEVIFEGKTEDTYITADLIDHPTDRQVVITRQTTFFSGENYLFTEGKLKKIPLPDSASLVGFLHNRAVALLRDDLETTHGKIAKGSLISLSLNAPNASQAEVVFSPTRRISVNSAAVAKNSILVAVLDNVVGKLLEFRMDRPGSWKAQARRYPDKGALNVLSVDPFSDAHMISFESFLLPETIYLQDGQRITKIKQAPSRFASQKFSVLQHEAISNDGTKIPYFLVTQKKLANEPTGRSPTVLFGYGGFEIAETPYYLGPVGKAWLERGGVYVVANIRGGGEFGPAWHAAALKENRQRAYDDFIAVAQDLVKRKITSPDHLGILGGSNGGLLTGAVTIQRPDLFKAAVIAVPLLDMVRYHLLPPGDSWSAEYGTVDDGDPVRSAILKYSPYQNVVKGRKYPKVFFVTSRKDDRVHPGHARKMAARMMEYGNPIYYYENAQGGHSGGANLEERARTTALYYTYFYQLLH